MFRRGGARFRRPASRLANVCENQIACEIEFFGEFAEKRRLLRAADRDCFAAAQGATHPVEFRAAELVSGFDLHTLTPAGDAAAIIWHASLAGADQDFPLLGWLHIGSRDASRSRGSANPLEVL